MILVLVAVDLFTAPVHTAADDPDIWFTSVESFAKVLSERNRERSWTRRHFTPRRVSPFRARRRRACRREMFTLLGNFPACREVPAKRRATTSAAFLVTWGRQVSIDVEGHKFADHMRRVATSEVPVLPEVTTIPACRVLVADDHAGVSTAIRRLLVAHDYEVVGSVEDGARVLEEAVGLQPDIILLDLHMPHMNGIDVCRELTRMLPRTRTIVVTAGDPSVVGPAVRAAGAFAAIDKAALHTDLLPAVRLACDEAAATASLT